MQLLNISISLNPVEIVYRQFYSAHFQIYAGSFGMEGSSYQFFNVQSLFSIWEVWVIKISKLVQLSNRQRDRTK